MDMQDKEFDKIFNKKFEDFEVEPSSTVWSNIAETLYNKKSTRSLLAWLSIAATLLIVVTAGVLFLKQGEQAGEQKGNTLIANRVKPTVPAKAEVGETKHTSPVLPAKTVQIAKLTEVIKRMSAAPQPNNVVLTKKIVVPVNVTQADVLDHEPLNNNQPIIATLPNPASTQAQATLPDVQLAPKMLPAEMQGTSAITASAEGQGNKPEKKHGIRNMGGLINAIVARLDKRDNKLIEFSDGDEDDDNGTVVTGVNLGLIKIKKQ